MPLCRTGSAGLGIGLAVACLLVSMLLAAPVAAAEAQNAVLVTIMVDGQAWEYVSTQPTTGAILNEAGVKLGPNDRMSCEPDAKAAQGMRIRITRIVERVVVQKEPIRFETVLRFSPSRRTGRAIVQQGEDGEKELKYLVTYKDGVKVGYELLEAHVIKEPVEEIVSISRHALLTSRGGKPVRSLRMLATAYDPGPRSCGKWASGYTAIGMKAGYGVVAVDPRVIPLRTKLYVEGYGYCVAGDVGGAIKGNRIDLGYATYREAIRFGRRWVTVYILK